MINRSFPDLKNQIAFSSAARVLRGVSYSWSHVFLASSGVVGGGIQWLRTAPLRGASLRKMPWKTVIFPPSALVLLLQPQDTPAGHALVKAEFLVLWLRMLRLIPNRGTNDEYRLFQRFALPVSTNLEFEH